jgi:hypothetical protein
VRANVQKIFFEVRECSHRLRLHHWSGDVAATIQQRRKRMKIQSTIKAAGVHANQTMTRGTKVKSNVKAGGIHFNHNQTGVKVKTNVKAGLLPAV